MATVTLTATPEPSNSPPRVRLDVTASGTPTVSSVVISRRDASGHTYPVRTADAGPLPISGGAATIYDYEAFYGQPLTYTTSVSGGPVAIATLDVRDIWLIHIGVPTRSVKLTAVTALGGGTRATTSGSFQILGRSDPVVVTSGARASAVSNLGVRTQTEQRRVDLNGLLDDDSPVLLNMPASKTWGVSSMYLSIKDVASERTVRIGATPSWEWTLPYQMISRPGGGTQAAITILDVAAQYASFQAIVNAGVTSCLQLAAPTN